MIKFNLINKNKITKMKNVFYLSLLVFIANIYLISSNATQKFMNNKNDLIDNEFSYNCKNSNFKLDF